MQRIGWWLSAAMGLLCLFSAAAAAAQDEPLDRTLAKVDDYMAAAVRYDAFSGTILVARNGSPLLTRSYGMANLELGVPNTAETVFRIGSVTKSFTAMAIMLLRDRGQLSLNDYACTYLGDCPSAWREITIRQLLTHTSGIPNYSSVHNWDEVYGRLDYRPGGHLKLVRDLPLDFTPGEKYAYSNSGYVVLSLVVEKVSGQPFGSFLDENIFRPLGMDNTTFNPTRAIIHNRAIGYYTLGTSFVNARYLSPTLAAGDEGVLSTVGDMLLWDQAYYSEKLVSRKTLDEMMTPEKGGYGYGWRLEERFGRPRVYHSGSVNGYSAYLNRFPTERLTVVVLTNSDETSASKVGNDLAAIVLGEPYFPVSQKLTEILWETTLRSGVADAIQQYRELRRTRPDAYDFRDSSLRGLGYDFLNSGRLDEAQAIFEFNLGLFPQHVDSNTALADVAVARGDTALAISLLQKSLQMDPSDSYASSALADLRSGQDR